MSEAIATQTTAMVITFNEAPNIDRCLARLTWAQRVLIVDSGSTDETLEIARRYPNVDIIERAFESFADQCNFGLSCIDSDWVLSLDADYILSSELETELIGLDPIGNVAFSASFRYLIKGRPLRGSLYPDRCVLYRRHLAQYRNEGHGHRVAIDGPVANLAGKIDHDDRKSLSRWLLSQQKYAVREADHLFQVAPTAMSKADHIRFMGWPAPALVFFYTLIWKRCVLEGWPGWFYALQRTLAEIMIALEVVDRRLNARLQTSERAGRKKIAN